MPEKPSGGKGLDPIRLTNSALRGAGKVLGWAARKGAEKIKEGADKRFEQKALDDIFSVMYPAGPRPVPGTPLPPYLTVRRSAADVEKFQNACNGLIDRHIPLHPLVKRFAADHFIRLKS